MPSSNARNYSSTIDFLTTTSSSIEETQRLYDLARSLEFHRQARGRKIEEKSFFGYVGELVEGLYFYGERNSVEGLFIAYSAFADEVFPLVRIDKTKVTRIDLAVTVNLKTKIIDLAKKCYDKVKSEGIPGNSRLMVSNSGQTLYCGSPKSERFARLYDKGGQMGDEKGKLWRYEVVIRKPRSTALSRMIFETLNDQGFTDRTREQITGYVYSYFLSKGVSPIFPPGDGSLHKLRLEYTETSAHRKLAWLRDQVKASVWWLVQNGYHKDTEQALGVQLELWEPDEYT